jgi:cupin 2 domain-containing protein
VSVERGSILPGTEAPTTGERVEVLSAGPGWRVEQILSGTLSEPVADLLDHEEWVVVLDGAAVVEIEADALELQDGDWIRIGAGVPHRVLSADPGTRWLALHVSLGAEGAGGWSPGSQ